MPSDSLLTLGSCVSDEEEYWYHVAPQQEMPLAGTARPPRLLADLDNKYPTSAFYTPGSLNPETVAGWILQNPELVHELRLVLSLSDKRFYLDISYLLSRRLIPGVSPATTVCGCTPQAMRKHSTSAIVRMLRTGQNQRRTEVASVIAGYLVARGLLVVLDLYFGLDPLRRTAINDLWLAPHDVQQNETKRRGHGAEAEIAQALMACGAAIQPPNKASDPMGAADPNISLDTFQIVPRVPSATVSTDIAVLDASGHLQVMIMGLVQSSDPGQFGVDKAATNGRIRERLDAHRGATGSTIELWGIVDGVGYVENPNGTINPMLRYFDWFVQHNSAYKAILGAARLGLCNVAAVRYDATFYSDRVAGEMHAKYAGAAQLLRSTDTPPQGSRAVSAGRATVWLA